ncbi:MAG TPA: hypothetical protein DCS93_27545 [Microscillaceae bacterium]|nr:hypothetical protein [Microscillaceae bacterium]
MDIQSKIKWLFISIYVLAIGTELIWAKIHRKQVYHWKDSLANLAIVIGGKIIKPLSIAWAYFLYSSITPYQLMEIEPNGFTLLVAFFLVEFIYYWYHRLSHEIPLLWTIHHTHHSSPWFNFTTAGRLNWLGKFTAPVFYIPLILIGFSPVMITLLLAFSLVYQIFIHTEMVGKLGFLEGLFLNTPSAHRVHHASNEGYLDKNYGGTLIIFDRIFGTYRPEKDHTKYGVTTGFLGHNPLVITFSPLIKFLGKKFNTKH